MRTLHALTIIMSAQQLSIACQAAGSTTARKALIRKHIKDVLQVLPEEDIVGKSSAILNRLCGMQEYRDSKCVCLYLSMPAGEVQSYRILQDAFDNGKRVFIPKVAGKNSQDLKIFELSSYSMISEFPKSKWGIPEPTKEFTDIAVDATYLGLVDCVILPGVAFDSSCGRVGHGKGYYGEKCNLRKFKTTHFDPLLLIPVYYDVFRLIFREGICGQSSSWKISTRHNRDCFR
jgi:5-formyltetrahydrofolate cyclo-ligase